MRSALLPTVRPVLSVRECGTAGSASGQTACPVHPTLRQSRSRHSNASPLCPGCPSPPLLLVWPNVCSLSPWLLDFHTVGFSVSSGWFSFLNCCCPFGCARRHSVSTYAVILVLKFQFVILYPFTIFTQSPKPPPTCQPSKKSMYL